MYSLDSYTTLSPTRHRSCDCFLIPKHKNLQLYQESATISRLRTMSSATRQDEYGFQLYHYHPSIAAAAIFVLLFAATTLYHGWQMARARCWIAIPLVVGGIRKTQLCHGDHYAVLTMILLVEVVGYVGRAISGHQSPDWTLRPYIIQAIFLLVAPVCTKVSRFLRCQIC